MKYGDWKYDVDRLGCLRLDPDPDVMFCCDLIVSFPLVNNEFLAVRKVGPIGPPTRLEMATRLTLIITSSVLLAGLNGVQT